MPDKFFFEGTEDKLQINFDPRNNLFEITGNSFPEESTNFYIPVLHWLDNYTKNPNESTHLICKIEYLNSLSAKFIFELFLILQKITSTGKTVRVSWYYNPNDDFIEEKGDEFKSALEIPFNLIPLN